jgi:hypothetical protein
MLLLSNFPVFGYYSGKFPERDLNDHAGLGSANP